MSRTLSHAGYSALGHHCESEPLILNNHRLKAVGLDGD